MPSAPEEPSLRESVDALTQGLGLMLEILGTHTEMLRTIVEAATAEPHESPLPKLLQQIVERLDNQAATLTRIEASIR